MARRPDTPCSGCGKLMHTTKGSLPADQRMCHPCRRAKPKDYRSKFPKRNCASCQVEFQPSGYKVRTCSMSCGQRLRCAEGKGRYRYTEAERRAAELEYWRAKNRRRRAAKRGRASEPYTLDEIAARDGHRCQLCQRKVDMRLSRPHRMSPTIDHIVPISRGGDDTRVNVQLAHFGCNSGKCNRGGGEQLMLVG